jgi:hypothetical protein
VTSSTQLLDGRVEVRDEQSKVLTEVGWRLGLEQVQLLAATCIEPGTAESEVRTVVPNAESHCLHIELDRLVNIANVDGYVVDAEGLHGVIVPDGDQRCVLVRQGWDRGA